MDTIETEQLIIRPFMIDDVEEAHQVLDLNIRWAGPSFTIEQRKKRLQFNIDLSDWAEAGRLYGWRAIVLKESGQLIGICGFQPNVWTPHAKALFWSQLFGQRSKDDMYGSLELDLGYALSSRYRGKGYATEAVRGIIDYAFGELKIKRIFAGTNRSNARSIKLMKRIGMRIANNPERPDEDWPDGPGVVGVLENELL